MGTRDDYDLAWKDALVKYLPDFLRFFFPRIYQEIDWSKTPRFLDKELQSVAPGGRRVVDTLVELHLLAGGPPLLVLVHVEVQAQKESGFEERVFRYNARLSDHYYPKPVCSLVILADNHRTWRPTIYRHNFWGSRIQFRFGVVKLLDFDEEKKLARLERSRNPFALLVAATLHTQQTRPVSDLRTDKKLAMLKALYRSGWGREKIVEFFNVVDRMMKLSPVQQRLFCRTGRVREGDENAIHQ